jgi:hypothetical protein
MLARALPGGAKLAAGFGMRVIEREIIRRVAMLFAELVEEILTADVLSSGIDAVIGILIFYELLAHGMPPIGDTSLRLIGTPFPGVLGGRSSRRPADSCQQRACRGGKASLADT